MNSLYFSPLLKDGHRPTYCQYYLKILVKYFEKTYVVTNCNELSTTVQTMLKPYVNSGLVEIITIEGGVNFRPDEFINLQNKLDVDFTIIEEADNHLALITQQISKHGIKLRGKIVGIFLRSNSYIYRRQLYASCLPYWMDELRRVKHICELWNRDPILFHKYFLPKYHLLDYAICLDEYFVNKYGKPHIWMPDIYFSLEETNLAIQTTERERYREPFEYFLRKNKIREKILYFGNADPRKGYDVLLKLAIDEEACFIHCGLNDDSTKENHYDVNEMRALLKKKDRLFEVNDFLLSRSAIEMFFMSVNYLVLPYYRHLGSSGAMLLALSYGKPVLVPNVGLMGRRVKDNFLGEVYRYNDYEDLRKKYYEFKGQTDQYQSAIQKFMSRFTEENVFAFIEQVVVNSLN